MVSKFWNALRRLGASDDELQAEERQRTAADSGADRISEVRERQAVRLRGTVLSLSMLPKSGTPWMEAELSDGSGTVTLVWMGRHGIPGISVGRELAVRGRVARADGKLRIYNPLYELIP